MHHLCYDLHRQWLSFVRVLVLMQNNLGLVLSECIINASHYTWSFIYNISRHVHEQSACITLSTCFCFFFKCLPIDIRSFSCEALVFFPLFPHVVSFLHTFYVFSVGSYVYKMALSFCLSQATSSNL